MNPVLQIMVMSCKCDCTTSCDEWRRQHYVWHDIFLHCTPRSCVHAGHSVAGYSRQWQPGHWMLRKHSDQKPMVGRQPLRPSRYFAGYRVRKFHVTGPLGNIKHSESLRTNHSSARNECKQCVWCGNIHRRYWRPAFDVNSTRILTTHLRVCGWVTSEWLVHPEACVTSAL